MHNRVKLGEIVFPVSTSESPKLSWIGLPPASRREQRTLIRYYPVGRANVMKFGSPLGSESCPYRMYPYTKEESIAQAYRKRNAFEVLVERRECRVTSTLPIRIMFHALMGSYRSTKCVSCEHLFELPHTRLSEILTRLNFPPLLLQINVKYRKARTRLD